MRNFGFLILLFVWQIPAIASDFCSKTQIRSVLKTNYQEASIQAGSIDDFDNRIEGFLNLYFESDQKFIFPLIALHGAKWAHQYFNKAELSLLLARTSPLSLLVYNKIQKIEKLADGLKSINRDVYIDVVAKYKTFLQFDACKNEFYSLGFSKDLINQLHNVAHKKTLNQSEKFETFRQMLIYEQKINVAPKIAKLAKELNLSKFEEKLFLRPKVRFSYFPSSEKFKFTNFFNTDERIRYALMAAQIAFEVGEENVVDSI